MHLLGVLVVAVEFLAQRLLLVGDAGDEDSTPGMSVSRPQYEASASGMPTIMISAPTYIGWRTRPYRPVDTTGWSSSTVIVAAA